MSEIESEIQQLMGKIKPMRRIKRAKPYEQYHPCTHRYAKYCPPKQLIIPKKFVLKPPPVRLDWISKPLCRRLLSVWINFGDVIKGMQKENVIKKLLDCGLTQADLDLLLEEERNRKRIEKILSEAGPFDVFDKNGNLLNPGSKVIKPKIRKSKKKKKTKSKPGEEGGKNKTSALKKGKRQTQQGDGKTKKSKSSKTAKKNKGKSKGKDKLQGDSQEQLGFDNFKVGKPGQLRPGWPHYIGIQLMLQVWKLTSTSPDEVYLSRARPYFDIQARILCSVVRQALGLDADRTRTLTPQDAKIAISCLNVITMIAQKIVTPSWAISDVDVQNLFELHGEEPKLKTKAEVNKKGRKKSPQDVGDEILSVLEPESDSEIDEVGSETVPEDIPISDENEEEYFKRTSKWYSPNVPEFFFDNNMSPPPAKLIFINENGTYRWHLESEDSMIPHPIVPHPVPPYYPELRTLSSEKETWFIPSEELSGNNERCSIHAIVEIFEMISDTLMTMITTPELSVSRLLELVSEVCLAVSLAMENENATLEDQMLDDKRTIILERLFVETVGRNFRDYNEKTKEYMRTLCHGAARFIRYLYKATSRQLWDLQQYQPETESLSESTYSPETEEPLYPCREWVNYLKDGCDEAKEWLQWLMKAMQEENESMNCSEVIEDAENWIEWGKIREKALRDLEAKLEESKMGDA